MSVFPLKIKRNGQRNEFKVHPGWIFLYKSTDRFNCYSHLRFCACWVGHYMRLARKKSNSQVRTNLRQKRTGKSNLKVTCILTMKSKVRFRKVAFVRGHKNDQNRKLTLTFSPQRQTPALHVADVPATAGKLAKSCAVMHESRLNFRSKSLS